MKTIMMLVAAVGVALSAAAGQDGERILCGRTVERESRMGGGHRSGLQAGYGAGLVMVHVNYKVISVTGVVPTNASGVQAMVIFRAGTVANNAITNGAAFVDDLRLAVFEPA